MIFFFNDTATTEIYPLSLPDALPIGRRPAGQLRGRRGPPPHEFRGHVVGAQHGAVASAAVQLPLEGLDPRHQDDAEDRKSTRLNSSHANISYAVFCLKKKRTPISYLR